MKSAEKPVWKSLLMWVLLVIAPALAPAAPGASGRDSLSSVVVEPGVTHISILKDGPFAINVLVVDLDSKNLRLESFRPTGLVRTSEQATRNSREGHVVLAAINADFFSFKTGWPVNIQVQNGEFVFGTQTQRSHLILDEKNRPHIQRTSFEGWVRSLRGKSSAISGINDVHKENAIILHTSFSDTATSSTGGGKVISVRLLNASWSVCDTLRIVVNGMGSHDLAHIPQGEAALWIGDGTSVSSAGDEVNVGDTLLVYLGIRPEIRNAKTILGGVGMIVANGKPVSDSINVGEKTNVNFLTARHPRTFVGFDRDTTKLFLCVVDGRQQTSVGMNFREMAEFLLSLGVWNAVNFDGGGSTTMVVRGKIVNSPSDKTGERPVANSLQIISLGTPASAR
jgi:exopolysaccharide biosynthesis protein